MSLNSVTTLMRKRYESLARTGLKPEHSVVCCENGMFGRHKKYKCAICRNPYSEREIASLCFKSCWKVVDSIMKGVS